MRSKYSLSLVMAASLFALHAEPACADLPAPAPSVVAASTAFEVNVLWPLFPGGLSELKLLVPVLRTRERDWRGEIIAGVYSDFATRFVRDDDRYGKVSILAALVGYRQFIASGIHLEVTATPGWRHEVHNVWDGSTLDAFTVRVWTMAGYQYEWSGGVYVNARGGGGLHVYRSDRFASKERRFAPAADVNVGFRF